MSTNNPAAKELRVKIAETCKQVRLYKRIGAYSLLAGAEQRLTAYEQSLEAVQS